MPAPLAAAVVAGLFLSGGFARAASADTAPAAPAPAPPPVVLPAERVLGIGGFFFRAKDPKALARWYATHLGINLTPRKPGDPTWQQTAGPTSFQPFSMKTDYIGPPDKQWMINFRVAHLDAMVAQLRASHVDVTVDPQTYPYGRFAHLNDPEGNQVELWEPAAPPEASSSAGH